MKKLLCKYGSHRVVSPQGSLPQAAQRLDPSLPSEANEIHIAVDTLNIDSASFAQIVVEVGEDADRVAQRITGIVAERGKMQNPVTGSGGMLLGTVVSRGSGYNTHPEVKEGDRIATLVSLTLTPLHIGRVRAVHMHADQVEIDGHAILSPSAPITRIPEDMDERLALASLDVCGAPAQVARLVKPGMKIAVIGAGKSGILCMAQARESMGDTGKIVGVDLRDTHLTGAKEAGLIDACGTCNAKDPLETMAVVTELLGGEADLVINTANVAETELSSILCAKDSGTVYFFNMATSFARAALGAEGVGKDPTLIIGNGYAPGHADLTLALIRKHKFVRQVFESVLG
jgi:L-erythro-3,5-diaminohexanoate dehydrogenase